MKALTVCEDCDALRSERDALAAQLAEWKALAERSDETKAELRAQLAEVRAELTTWKENFETVAEHRDDIERLTVEQIAAWLDAKSTEYGKRRDASTNDCLRDEFGWAWSYADGFAQDIRSGAWKTKPNEGE